METIQSSCAGAVGANLLLELDLLGRTWRRQKGGGNKTELGESEASRGAGHSETCPLITECSLWANWAVMGTWIPEFPIRPARSECLVDVARESASHQNVPRSPRYASGSERHGCGPRLSTASGYGANALGFANSVVPTAVFPFTTL